MLGFIDGDFLFFHTLHKSSPPRVHLRVLLSHTGYALSALCQVPPWFLFIVSQNYNPMRLIYISKLTSRFLKVNNTLLPHRQCPCGLLVCTVNRTVRWPKTKHWMKPKFIQKEQVFCTCFSWLGAEQYQYVWVLSYIYGSLATRLDKNLLSCLGPTH